MFFKHSFLGLTETAAHLQGAANGQGLPQKSLPNVNQLAKKAMNSYNFELGILSPPGSAAAELGMGNIRIIARLQYIILFKINYLKSIFLMRSLFTLEYKSDLSSVFEFSHCYHPLIIIQLHMQFLHFRIQAS